MNKIPGELKKQNKIAKLKKLQWIQKEVEEKEGWVSVVLRLSHSYVCMIQYGFGVYGDLSSSIIN